MPRKIIRVDFDGSFVERKFLVAREEEEDCGRAEVDSKKILPRRLARPGPAERASVLS